MQPCIRQSRCVFCRFRPFLRESLKSQQHRLYRTLAQATASDGQSQKDRVKEISIRKGGSKKSRDRAVLGRGGISGVTSSVFRPKELERKLLQDRVHSALASVGSLWDDEPGTGRDYVTTLTPDKARWEQFEDSVKMLLESGSGSGSSSNRDLKPGSQKSLVDRLKKDVHKDNWLSHLKTVLKFAYVDQILQENYESKNNNDWNHLDLRYPTEWYANARCVQRHIHLHVGPTNSGKTYNALKRLEESRNGFYAGPLRLLAHEVFSRFNNRGIACDLVTGDDVRLSDDEVNMYCSTVEMVDIGKRCDVGIIDEIQMMGSSDRGWAWTRALLGSQAKELHLCGEARVVPLVRELVASMGDTLHIHQYDRLNPLKVMSRSLKGNLKNLRKGDCVVSFSVMNIHALKRQIELETNKRVAIVYGSLPPETRAQQAALFNDPNNDYDYLVASDAVGMGLNLSIKRVIFEKTMKYNGFFHERLTIPQIKQIAGRAGRFRTSNDDKTRLDDKKPSSKVRTNVGLVSCLEESDLPIIQRALQTEAAPIKAAGLLPPGEIYERAALIWPKGLPFEYIMRRVHQIVSLNPRYNLCDVDDQLNIARAIDKVPNLTIHERLTVCAAPASLRGRMHDEVVVAFAQAIADKRTVSVCDIPEIPLEILDERMSANREYLEGLEILHKTLNMFLWLHYRFTSIFGRIDIAIRAKELTEEKINACLVDFSANPKLRNRLAKIREASALLQEQTNAEFRRDDSLITMNPDATVEEIDRKAREERQERAIGDFVNNESADDDDDDDQLKPHEQTAFSYEWGKQDEENESVILPHERDVIEEVSKGTC